MSARRWGWIRWTIVALVVLAWALRLPPALENRFHPDEALYGTWGLLISWWKDPLLADVPVYKPPLVPYLIAGTQALAGNSELIVRLPGLLAGVAMVPLVAALTQALFHRRWATLGAATALALSPFAILFSATAFTDLPMVALGLAACLMAARGRMGWAGVVAGLSLAAKQTGAVWLPLALGLAWLREPAFKRWLWRFVGPLLGVAGAILVWDVARVASGGKSFWRTGVSGFGGLRLIWPHELWSRLQGWWRTGRYLFVSPVLLGVLVVSVGFLTWRALRRRDRQATTTDLLLVTFFLAYGLFHWLLAFPIWDRYLLPLLPVASILLGRGLALMVESVRGPAWIAPAALAALLLVPALRASVSYYPVGGDHGAYDGIDEVADYLGRRPEGSVVYQHWLGWQYDYYLFDDHVYVGYWPHPAWLARDVVAFGERTPHYITFPSWESPARVAHALAEVGYALEPVLETTRRDGTRSFIVYRIERGASR